MSAERLFIDTQTSNIFTRTRDRLFGAEKADIPVRLTLPSSPHFKQYYTDPFFEALYPQDPQAVRFLTEDLVQRVESPVLDIHKTSNEPATDIKREFEVATERAETIARDYLLDLLDPSKTPSAVARRTLLVTSIDLLLASYFGKGDFKGIVFYGQTFNKDGRLQTIEEQLASLAEGDTFRILAQKRNIDVTILPMPQEGEHFQSPRFCLIGPRESGETDEGFVRILEQSIKNGKRIVFEAKRNQLELTTASLQEYNPSRIIVTEEGTGDYRVFEKGRWKPTDSVPKQKKESLEFWISVRAGNVDGYVRRRKNSLKTEKDKADIFGLDVVQTGGSLRQNNLVEIRQILPGPCSAVLLKAA